MHFRRTRQWRCRLLVEGQLAEFSLVFVSNRQNEAACRATHFRFTGDGERCGVVLDDVNGNGEFRFGRLG